MTTLNRITKGLRQFLTMQVIAAAGSIALDASYAFFFGVGPSMEAFFGAVAIFNSSSKLLHGGALQDVFMPIFMEQRKTINRASGWSYLNSLLNLMILASLILSFVCFVLAPILSRVMLPGFDLERRLLVISLFRWLAPTIPFSIAIGLTTAVLQSERRFLITEGIPNIAMFINILVVISLAKRWGSLALVLGVWARTLVTVVGLVGVLWKQGYRPHACWGFTDERVCFTLRKTAPYLGSTLSAYGCSIANQAIYSTLPAGGYAIYRFASNTFSRFVSFLIPPLATVSFPEMIDRAISEAHALSRFLFKGIRLMAYVLIPCTLAAIVLRMPLTSVFLKRGMFNTSDAVAVASAFGIMMLGLFGEGLISLLTKSYVALKEIPYMVAVSVGGQVFFLALAALLVHKGVNGIAWAGVIMVYTNAVFYMVGLRKRLSIRTLFINSEFMKLAITCGLVGWFGVVLVSSRPLQQLFHMTVIPSMIGICLTGGIMMMMVQGLGYWFHIPEAHIIADLFREKSRNLMLKVSQA